MPEMFKKVFELSHSDVRTQLYKVLDSHLEDNQYSWIRDVYDDHFVVEIDTVTEDNYQTENVKYNYSKSDNDQISIDLESRKEVMKKTEWVELEATQQLQAQVDEKEEIIQSLNSEKEELQGKFNKASDKLTSLNSKVEELSEYKEKYDTEQFEKQLNEKKELYSAKFSALSATDKYESDEVQELIKEAVTSDEAIVSLNSILVDLVELKEENKDKEKGIVQLNNKRQNLVPTETDFDSRYK